VSEPASPEPPVTPPVVADLMGVAHPAILATTVCAIVEHGGSPSVTRLVRNENAELGTSTLERPALMRLAATLAAIGAVALAGGASLKGF